MGGPAEDAHCAGFLLPFQHAVVGYVAPQEAAQIPEPHRPLGEPAAVGDRLDCSIAEHQRRKARVEDFDPRIGVADRVRAHLSSRCYCHPGARLKVGSPGPMNTGLWNMASGLALLERRPGMTIEGSGVRTALHRYGLPASEVRLREHRWVDA